MTLFFARAQRAAAAGRTAGADAVSASPELLMATRFVLCIVLRQLNEAIHVGNARHLGVFVAGHAAAAALGGHR